MANNVIKRVWNQNRMVAIEDLKGMTFQAESGGHTFQISGVDDAGNVIALSGSVAGVFLRPDNTDVAITGSASGGVVSVTLPANCYDVPGRFGLTVFVTANGQKTAVYAAMGTVSRTSSGTVSPGTTSDVVDLINRINAAVATIPASWTGLMADIAPTYSDAAVYPVGAYCYYNGDLYRCITAITTAESWTAGHWTQAVLGNDVSDLKSAFNANCGTTTLQFVKNYYIPLYQSVGSEVDLTPIFSSSGTSYTISECSAGDIFYLNGIGGNDPRLWAFIDSNNLMLASADAGTEANMLKVVAPANSAKIIVNFLGSSVNPVAFKGEAVSPRMSRLSTDIVTFNESLNVNCGADNIQFTLDCSINCNVSVGQEVDLTPVVNRGSARCAIVNCAENDIFTINGTGGNDYRLWAFVDSNNLLLKKSDANVTANAANVVAPENASKIILNLLGTSVNPFAIKGETVNSRLLSLESETEDIEELLNNITSFKATKGIVKSGMASTADGYIHPFSNSYCVELPVERDKTYIVLIKGTHNRESVFGINNLASGSPATLIVGGTTGSNMVSYSRVIKLSNLQYQYIVINLLYDSSQTDVTVDIYSYENPDSYLLNGEVLATQTQFDVFDGVYRTKSVSDGVIITDNLVQSAVIPVIHDTLYRLEANGDFNRFIVYGASSYNNGSSADLIYGLGRNKQTNITKDINSGTYNFLIVILNYNNNSVFSFNAKQVLGTGGTLLGVDYVQKYKFDEFYERVFPTEYHASFDTALVNTYSDVLSLYDALKNAYPNYITKNALNNDNTIIYEYVFTTGAYNNVVGLRPSDTATPKPKVLITTGVHGYEKSAVMSTYAFAKSLCEDYSLRKLREQLEIHIVPVAAPYTYDNDSRQNANSVNINRNFDSPNWTSETVGDENNPGPYAGSEYETQALQSWMDSNTDASIYIDHHNSAYTNECCWFGANSALTPSVYQPIKKSFWNGIKPLYPYWRDYRNINPSENVYAYTGTTATTGSTTSYAAYKGIPAFSFETSWEQNNTTKNGRYTIAVGAEAFANMMLGLFAYLNGELNT